MIIFVPRLPSLFTSANDGPGLVRGFSTYSSLLPNMSPAGFVRLSWWDRDVRNTFAFMPCFAIVITLSSRINSGYPSFSPLSLPTLPSSFSLSFPSFFFIKAGRYRSLSAGLARRYPYYRPAPGPHFFSLCSWLSCWLSWAWRRPWGIRSLFQWRL